MSLLAAGAAALVVGGVAVYTFMAEAGDARAPLAPAAIARAAEPVASPAGAGVVAPAVRMMVEPAPAAVARPTVVVKIESMPIGAEVFRIPSETKVGVTPWSSRLPSEAGVQVFVVRKPGFVDRRIEVDLRTGGTIAVTLLHPAHRPAVAPAVVPPTRHKGDPVDPFATRTP
jgi:hypothetical protein